MDEVRLAAACASVSTDDLRILREALALLLRHPETAPTPRHLAEVQAWMRIVTEILDAREPVH